MIGLSLEIPARVADRAMLNHMREAFQSDVQYKVKIPMICNVSLVQRGEVLKLFVPSVAPVAPPLAVRNQTTASVVEGNVPPPVAMPQNVAKAKSVVTTKGAKGKGKK